MQEGGKRLHNDAGKPRLSIITAVYNAVALFPAYIENVVPYLNDEVELVVIDGGSTDGTVQLLHQHSNSINYWRSEPDNGIYDAMNKALLHARGQWLFFLGVDDYLTEGFASMPARLKNAGTIYYGNTVYYGKPFKKEYSDYFLTKLNFIHQSLFYTHKVFERYRYDWEKYPVYADYYLNLKLWADNDFRFEYCDVMVAGFPEGGFSSTAKDPQFELDRDALYRKYLKRGAYYRYLNRTLGWFKALLRIFGNG